MEDRIIGRDPRILIIDEVGWREIDLVEGFGDLGGRVVIGLDLASRSDMAAEIELRPYPLEQFEPLELRELPVAARLRSAARSHPTTAAELRRSERRRRR